VLAAGCAVTEPTLTPGGQAVRVGQTLADASGCQLLGKVVGYSSNLKQDVAQQREVNARNLAAGMGGTLIVPGQANLMTVGGREFEVYRCPH
jgi:Domain of unknown function (DUF4156)